jgi:diguanylate cyclase (GGDEF)-like protein
LATRTARPKDGIASPALPVVEPESATPALSVRLRSRVQTIIRSVRFAAAPAIATPRVMAKTAGLLYLSAATLSLAGLALPQRPGVDRPDLTAIACVALVVGVAMLVAGHRWPRWSYHLLILNGNLLIGLGIYESGGGRTSIAYGSLFMFVAVDCFFFFAWPSACVHLSIAVVACCVSLMLVHDAGFGQMVILPGSLVVVSMTVGWLVRAADAAEFDTLTGLPNRRGLDRYLSVAVAAAAVGDHPLTVVFLDVDNFRAVNQDQGQGGGDRLLRSIATAWRPLIRDGEVLARNGGDEFALLLTDVQAGGALAAAARLRAAMPAGHTCSAGVADWEPGDSVSLLSARADTALYESKRNGRNRVTHHDSSRNVEAAEIRRAVAAGEIVAYYQPVVELSTGVVTGFEALARWIRPGHEMVPPDMFIPQAEASGAIEDIGRLMLINACQQTAVWSKLHGRPFVANVNVCGRELRNPHYVAQVKAILADAEVPASQLVLELTETAFDGDAEPVVFALEELHAFGIGIAIDDFGTGYSSLSRLDRLPVDVVKIDRSFVSTLSPDATRAPLVAAITAMARALGLRVVAEGIEHPYQAALMLTLGCDKGQGYWYDRPCPADRVDLSARAPVTVALRAEQASGLRIVG